MLLKRDLGKASDEFYKGLTISIQCGFKRYIHRIQNEIISFVHLPKFLEEFQPQTINYLDLVSKVNEIHEDIFVRGSEMPIAEMSEEEIKTIVKQGFWVYGNWKRSLEKRKYLAAYLQVIDEQTLKPTDEIVTWAVAHGESSHDANGRWHTTVAVLLCDKSGDICLQIRGEKDSKGKLDASAAGHVDVGEKDLESAVRELYEELGIYVEPTRFKRIGEPLQFKKEGRPNVADNKFENAYVYRYKKSSVNLERSSFFLVKVSDREKDSISKIDGLDALCVEWKSLDETLNIKEEHPDRMASTIHQILHPEIISMIKEVGDQG